MDSSGVCRHSPFAALWCTPDNRSATVTRMMKERELHLLKAYGQHEMLRMVHLEAIDVRLWISQPTDAHRLLWQAARRQAQEEKLTAASAIKEQKQIAQELLREQREREMQKAARSRLEVQESHRSTHSRKLELKATTCWSPVFSYKCTGATALAGRGRVPTTD